MIERAVGHEKLVQRDGLRTHELAEDATGMVGNQEDINIILSFMDENVVCNPAFVLS